MVTNAQGQQLARNDFFPFGTEASSMRQEIVRGYEEENLFKFTGHERDYAGGTATENPNQLDYMHARYYSPVLGRFTAVDPGKDWDVRFPQTWNLYAYGRNNPIMRVDPNGLSALVYNDRAKYIALYNSEGVLVGAWRANNNVDSSSKGDWPAGTFTMQDQSEPYRHGGQKDTIDGEYGTRGIFRAETFSDDGKTRTGMGVHAGRANDTDGLGRSGPDHATMGCIRTTEEAMQVIEETAALDPVETIEVQTQPVPPRTDLILFDELYVPAELEVE